MKLPKISRRDVLKGSAAAAAGTFVASARVLAVPQGDPGNAAMVQYVEVDAPGNAFTIHMTEAVAADTPLAWFLMD